MPTSVGRTLDASHFLPYLFLPSPPTSFPSPPLSFLSFTPLYPSLPLPFPSPPLSFLSFPPPSSIPLPSRPLPSFLPSLLLHHVLFYPELPLVLFDSGYEGIDWQENAQTSQRVIGHFQELWTSLAVKTTMVSRMLDTLTASHRQRSGPSGPAVPNAHLNALMTERIVQKSHKPLLTRPTAGGYGVQSVQVDCVQYVETNYSSNFVQCTFASVPSPLPSQVPSKRDLQLPWPRGRLPHRKKDLRG